MNPTMKSTGVYEYSERFTVTNAELEAAYDRGYDDAIDQASAEKNLTLRVAYEAGWAAG